MPHPLFVAAAALGPVMQVVTRNATAAGWMLNPLFVAAAALGPMMQVVTRDATAAGWMLNPLFVAAAALGPVMQVVTRDATAAGGAAPLCAGAVRAGFALMWKLAESAEGRQVLQERFRLCKPLTGQEDVTALGYWIQVGWG
jgi:hypothetical protein